MSPAAPPPLPPRDPPAEESALPSSPEEAPGPGSGKRFPCRQCGSGIEFHPKADELVCPHCGHREEIPRSAEQVGERSFEDYLDPAKGGSKLTSAEDLEIRCKACGAITRVDPSVVTEKCPFCSTDFETAPTYGEPTLEPSALLPFAIERERARGEFRSWVKGLWFAPSKLKHVDDVNRLAGLYAPAFTYDAITKSFYAGQRGDDHTTTNREGRRTTRTSWTHVQGSVAHRFDDLVVVASHGIPGPIAAALGRWDLERLVDFRPEFLAGYRTERAQIDLKRGFERAREVMDAEIRELCRRDIGGDRQQVDSVRTDYSAIAFRHVLLPMWVSSYRFGERTFQVVVNGRTAVVAGDRPWSPWKIAAAVVSALTIAGLLYAMFGN